MNDFKFGGGSREKSQISNLKFQTNPNNQTPIGMTWNLKFEYWDLFGICVLTIGIFSSIPSQFRVHKKKPSISTQLSLGLHNSIL